MLDKDDLFYVTMQLAVEKGTKFTMDELAARLGISKRTLYETIRSKDELAVFLVNRYFEIASEKQKAIREDKSLDIVDKIRKLLTTNPEIPMARYRMVEFRMQFKDAYKLFDEKLTTGWENTFRVMDQAVRQGRLKKYDKKLFSAVFSSAIEGLTMEFNQKSNMTFDEMEAKLVDMMLFGIVKQ